MAGPVEDIEKAAAVAVATVKLPSSVSTSTLEDKETAPEASSGRRPQQEEEGLEDAAAFEPPDGGLAAWLQVLSGFLTSAVAWGYPSMFGVYQLHYISAEHLAADRVAWIGATQTFLTYLMCTVSGRLCDAGHARPVTLAGTALVTVGTLATSLAAGSGDGHYWATFLAQGVCTGLGLGLLTAPGLTAITAYFRRKRSLALSVATMGTSFGSAVFPAVVQYLIPTVGFPWAVRCSAAVSLVFGLVAYALLLPPPPRLRRRRGAAPAAAAAEQQADPPARSLVDWPAFREPPFVCFVVASFLIFWALYFGFFYINVFGEDVLAFPPASAASLLIIATATGMPMRPLAGYVADFCLGAVNTFALSAAFLAATLFAWTGVHTAPAMYVFAVLFGLANGAAQGVWVGCLVALTRDQARVGTRFGMVCTLAAFAALAGPPTASSIVGATGTYTWAQLWAGAAIMLGTAAVVVGRTYLVGCRVCVRV